MNLSFNPGNPINQSCCGSTRLGGWNGSEQNMVALMQMLQQMQALMASMGSPMGSGFPGSGGVQDGSPMIGGNPGFGGSNGSCGCPQGMGQGGPGPFLGVSGGQPTGNDGNTNSAGAYGSSNTQDQSSNEQGSSGASSAGSGNSRVGGPTGQLVQRRGGRLDSSIAPNFDSMVTAARNDGVRLEIRSGHRSRAEQERLYAAYRSGRGNLAARPGSSNHERGQAIDFRRTPGAFDWLARNAERFGFRNLPGEPWHYSPTGR